MSRELILEKLRKSADARGPDASQRKALIEDRISAPQPGILPVQPRAKTAVVNKFIDRAREAQATVQETTSEKLAGAIADWLKDQNLPAQLRMGTDARLDPIRKAKRSPLTIDDGPASGDDFAAVSHAECGICETGTLALLSGPDNPTTLNFLPPNHIVVLNRSDIVTHYEEIWPRLRRKFGARGMPRTVNLVTGPSRSADIEQTLFLGAHGPVRLHILIVRD